MPRRIANLMGSGFSGAAASFLNGTGADGATATGSTQGTALPVPGDCVTFTTVAASTGTILPANCSPGDEQFIKNLGANSLSVYPPVGESIDSIATNGAYSLATTKSALFFRTSATRWASLLSA